MNMKDVIKEVYNLNQGNLYERIEKEKNNLNRLKSLTQILVAMQDVASDIVDSDNIDKIFKFKFEINSDYPTGIAIVYQIDDGEKKSHTIAPYDENYSIFEFLNEIHDNALKNSFGAELKIDHAFKERILPKIIGVSLYKKYCEDREKMEIWI